MKNINLEGSSFSNKAFNIASDTGVQFAVGNACLFWSGGGVAQLAATAALAGGVALKACSEFGLAEMFSKKIRNVIVDPNTSLKAASISLSVIAIDFGMDGDVVPMLTSSAFAIGNMRVAGSFENIKDKMSEVFGKVAGQITTQAETFYTVGLGLAAYMAAGDSTVSLPFIDQTIPTSMLTFVPTAIGGSLAVRNAISDDPNKSKPFLWLAGGVAATSAAGILGGAILPAMANIAFSSAYIKIQSDIEGGYSELASSIKSDVQKLLNRIV